MKNLLLLFITIVFLSGCSTDKIPDNFIPKGANVFCKQFIDSLKNGDTTYCFSQFDKEYQTQQAMVFLKSTFDHLQNKKIVSSRIISSNSTKILGQNRTNYQLEYEYAYSNNLWVYYSFMLFEQNNKIQVLGFNIQPSNQSLDQINEFTFKGKSFIHYFTLFLLLVILIFIIVTLVFAAKMKLKRKWLWIIFILIGFFKFQLNWTTGQIGFQLLTINLLGIGVAKIGIVGDWIVSVGLPIGAIYFWIKRGDILFENEMNEKLEKEKKE